MQLTKREVEIFNRGLYRGTQGTEEFVQRAVSVVTDLLLKLKGSSLEECKDPEKLKTYRAKAYKRLEIFEVPESLKC
jgi:hypothetical protein